jgi:ribosomal protein S18 acetylase RimI-like enzyme
MTQSGRVATVLQDYPKEVILKDGTGVTLRPLKAGDEKPLYDMFRRFSEDDLWFLNYDVSDPKQIEAWVNTLEPDRVVSIVAVLEGRIIANAALMMKHYGAKSHIGKIRISVDPGYRDKRLGTWMLLDLINLAMAVGLKMLVMRLVRDRDALILDGVEKLNFFEEAVLKNYVLDRQGIYHNLVIMIKRLPVEWDDF